MDQSSSVQTSASFNSQKQVQVQQQSQKPVHLPKLTKEDMSTLMKNTKFDVPTIKQWHKAFYTECPSGRIFSIYHVVSRQPSLSWPLDPTDFKFQSFRNLSKNAASLFGGIPGFQKASFWRSGLRSERQKKVVITSIKATKISSKSMHKVMRTDDKITVCEF